MTNGFGSPTADDLTLFPLERSTHTSCGDPPDLGLSPPPLIAYDAISPTHITYISTPPPPLLSQLSPLNGPQPFTPTSPITSPTNLVDNNIDFFLNKKTLDLRTLTIHKPKKSSSPHINPTSAGNIRVCQKYNKDSRHFRRHPLTLPFSLCDPHTHVDVLIASSNHPWALRENTPALGMT